MTPPQNLLSAPVRNRVREWRPMKEREFVQSAAGDDSLLYKLFSATVTCPMCGLPTEDRRMISFAIPYVASGFVVGFVVGLTGVGGGSLMTPILGYYPARCRPGRCRVALLGGSRRHRRLGAAGSASAPSHCAHRWQRYRPCRPAHTASGPGTSSDRHCRHCSPGFLAGRLASWHCAR